MFLVLFVCLSVCLSDCKQDCTNPTTIHKTWWNGVAWAKEEPSIFWVTGRLYEFRFSFANIVTSGIWAWQKSALNNVIQGAAEQTSWNGIHLNITGKYSNFQPSSWVWQAGEETKNLDGILLLWRPSGWLVLVSPLGSELPDPFSVTLFPCFCNSKTTARCCPCATPLPALTADTSPVYAVQALHQCCPYNHAPHIQPLVSGAALRRETSAAPHNTPLCFITY